MAFIFRHAELGELGRMLLQERTDGQTQITCSVVGDPNDPMTAKRAAIFEPIGRELSNQLEQVLGGSSEPASRKERHSLWPPPNSIEKVASKLIPCSKCGRSAALLIFADYAQDRGGLEDYARLMYPKVVELNVHTWVISPPEGQGKDAAAKILKTWPKREPICQLAPDEFNEMLERVIATHC